MTKIIDGGLYDQTQGGDQRVSAKPYTYSVAEGEIVDHRLFFMMGYNGDVDNAEEAVWPVGGAYVFPTGGMKMEIVSTSTNDHASGSGVKKVRVSFLNTKFEQKTTDVSMNGTGVVTLASTDMFRINRLRTLTVGSGGMADGNISLRHLADTPIYGRISKGYNRSRDMVFTVPTSNTAFITDMTVSCGNPSGNRFARFTFESKYCVCDGENSSAFLPSVEMGIQDGGVNKNFVSPIKITAGTDMRGVVIGDAANADAMCSMVVRGWLESD